MLDFPARDLSAGLVHSSLSGLVAVSGQETLDRGKGSVEPAWFPGLISLRRIVTVTVGNGPYCGFIINQDVKIIFC